MDLNAYAKQQFQNSLEWFPNQAGDLVHQMLGMVGEAGECANLVKKWDRDSMSDEELREKLPDELADVLIYVFSIAGAMGFDMAVEVDKKNEFNRRRFGHE